MAYSNDQTQIKMGFANYIGALLKASPWDNPREARLNINNILIDNVVALSKDEEQLDLYVFKPTLKATILFCRQRIKQLKDIPKDISTPQINKYNEIISTLENIINKL